MSTLQLISVDDDHPLAFVRLVATPSNATITPGSAGGLLSDVARPFMIDNGLVTEPRTDTSSDYLSIELVDAPSGTYDISVGAIASLDGVQFPLAITIHVVPGPTIFVDPEAAIRTPIFR